MAAPFQYISKRLKLKGYWQQVIAVTVFVYAFMGAVSLIPLNIDILNPISDALSDFELNDVVFSKLRDDNIMADTSIVLVNIGKLPRSGIAAEITAIAAQHPKAIAIDAMFFKQGKDPDADTAMLYALKKGGNVILVSKLLNLEDDNFQNDSVGLPAPIFRPYTTAAFANLITEGERSFKTVRTFTPAMNIKGKQEIAFSVAIAQKLNPEAANAFLARNNVVEIINFRRTQYQYLSLDVADVLDSNFSMPLDGKIVLMGYMGESFEDPTWEDKFYTPLNEKFAGHAQPDMFGVAVHANIISMINAKDYITEVPSWLNIIIGIFINFIFVALFSTIIIHAEQWYDISTKLLQLVGVVVLTYVTLIIFEHYSLKLNLTIGIAALALSGDLLEVYMGLRLYVMKQLLKKKYQEKKTMPNS